LDEVAKTLLAQLIDLAKHSLTFSQIQLFHSTFLWGCRHIILSVFLRQGGIFTLFLTFALLSRSLVKSPLFLNIKFFSFLLLTRQNLSRNQLNVLFEKLIVKSLKSNSHLVAGTVHLVESEAVGDDLFYISVELGERFVLFRLESALDSFQIHGLFDYF